MAKHGVLGISFDHMHMGDLLRQVAEHPDAEIAGIFDPDRKRGWRAAIATFAIPEERVFTDLDACLSQTRADLAIVCSATAEHANTVETIAPHGLQRHGREAVRGERRRCTPDDRGDGEGRTAARHQLAGRPGLPPTTPPSG